ncbi:methylglyoxal synthase [Saccharophagus degradans]|uniref:Methylglyoxal synthase n=1 Tax=Saccharophagus degradans (strain 2-40 / ATCC 43961 / DSM 17024) TaxID=203122 RepID=MGSA_SACD2|nr:methylglyoxal synthase [Saccharophagus degradans]Q21L65.1 RecName: Full=Methylglyoxal synthase; Short=MGS [Saccharophagus degradans 2-40]ABD80564.1 methylglyoxal synthase [Saccharophagus degradans 2-40]
MKSRTGALPSRKQIALIAHDNKKQELSDWVCTHKKELEQHDLFATGTTGYKLAAETGLKVEKYISGPLGGDQQIGAKISTGEIDVLIFFWDPFEPMPHDPDVKALLRIAAVWNIPVACNPASADFVITSPLIKQSYERQIPDYEAYIAERTKKL